METRRAARKSRDPGRPGRRHDRRPGTAGRLRRRAARARSRRTPAPTHDRGRASTETARSRSAPGASTEFSRPAPTPRACRSSSPASTSSAAASTDASPWSCWRCSARGAIPLTYLLGRRMAGPVAGLIGATAIAIYPALLDYQGLLLTEPLAAFLLSAALVVFLRPRPDRPSPWRWLGRGALLGALSLVRPEYLGVAVLLPLAWLARRGPARAAPALGERWRECCCSGRSSSSRPGRFATRSSSTGSCRSRPAAARRSSSAPTSMPTATGRGLRELLLSERPALRERLSRGGPVDDPDRFVLERVLSRVAAERYPGLETDAALGRMGTREPRGRPHPRASRFRRPAGGQGLRNWTDAPRAVMERSPGGLSNSAMVVLALLGLAVLAARRRFEACDPRSRPGVHDRGRGAADRLAAARARRPAGPRRPRRCRGGGVRG